MEGEKKQGGKKKEKGGDGDAPTVDVARVLAHKMDPFDYTYTERDLMLYALGVGSAAEKPRSSEELKFTYELHPEFQALPTFGVVPPFAAVLSIMNVPGMTFNPMMLLHGETYLEVRQQPSTRGTLTNHPRIVGVYDKKSGASVTLDVDTRDEDGKIVYFNRFTVFIRGIGGFGGPSGPAVDDKTVEKVTVPKDRKPDAVIEEKTVPWQALLYRLSGDMNPLHADPDMAAMGGFKAPILHGLCTFGFAGRAVLRQFCDNDSSRMKAIKIRFSSPVFPGETLRTSMWKVDAETIAFSTTVVERNVEVLTQSYAKITNPKSSKM